MASRTNGILTFTVLAAMAACGGSVQPSNTDDDGSGASSQGGQLAVGGSDAGGSDGGSEPGVGGNAAQGGSSQGGTGGAGGSAELTCDDVPAPVGGWEVCGGGGTTSSSGSGGQCELECHDEGNHVFQVSCNGNNCACLYDGDTLCTCQASDSFCGEICCPEPWKSMGGGGAGGSGPSTATVSTSVGVGGGGSSVATTSGGN